MSRSLTHVFKVAGKAGAIHHALGLNQLFPYPNPNQSKPFVTALIRLGDVSDFGLVKAGRIRSLWGYEIGIDNLPHFNLFQESRTFVDQKTGTLRRHIDNAKLVNRFPDQFDFNTVILDLG